MNSEVSPSKIIIFTGAGMSAESGINTFRGKNGTWLNIDPMTVASTTAWATNPQAVLDFHNGRLQTIKNAEPNTAHLAVAELEKHFEVIVITQNIDDLHERAGSTNVLHLHGCALEVCTASPIERRSVRRRGYEPLKLGDVDENGEQLRPNVVWFGEPILHLDEAATHIAQAGRIMVVGTSLSVYPAAGLVQCLDDTTEKVLIAHNVVELPHGFRFIEGNATEHVPKVVENWIADGT